MSREQKRDRVRQKMATFKSQNGIVDVTVVA